MPWAFGAAARRAVNRPPIPRVSSATAAQALRGRVRRLPPGANAQQFAISTAGEGTDYEPPPPPPPVEDVVLPLQLSDGGQVFLDADDATGALPLILSNGSEISVPAVGSAPNFTLPLILSGGSEVQVPMQVV